MLANSRADCRKKSFVATARNQKQGGKPFIDIGSNQRALLFTESADPFHGLCDDYRLRARKASRKGVLSDNGRPDPSSASPAGRPATSAAAIRAKAIARSRFDHRGHNHGNFRSLADRFHLNPQNSLEQRRAADPPEHRDKPGDSSSFS